MLDAGAPWPPFSPVAGSMAKKKVSTVKKAASTKTTRRTGAVQKPARLKPQSDVIVHGMDAIILDTSADVIPHSDGPPKARTKHSKVKRSIKRKQQKAKSKGAAKKQRRKGIN